MNTSRLAQLIGDLRQKPIVLALLLVFLTLLLYAPVAHHQFLDFDDNAYITNNIHVSTGLKPENVVWAFTSFWEANWDPITWLSHMVDCQLFGLNPGPPHLVNAAFHAANVLLLFFLLRAATGAVWRSFLVAALFAVHPLNVETVAWAAERKSLLCTFFSLLTVAAYGWYARRPGWKRYVTVVVAFALALMSKPMAVTLPVVLLLLDYWPLERYEDRPLLHRCLSLSLEKLPLFLMSAASSAITVAAQRSGGALAELSQLPLSLRMENVFVSYVAYLEKLFWPANLAVFYPLPKHSLPLSSVIASVVLLGAVTLAAVYFRRARYLAWGWFFFLISLIPVIGLVQIGSHATADRFAYVPFIGLFVVIAWGLGDLADVSSTKWLLPTAAALCVLVALSVATTRDLWYWQDGVRLFTHARDVAGQPDPSIEEDLGDALLSASRSEEAFQHYGKACELRPTWDKCHYNMAEILYRNHFQLREALDQYWLAGKYAEDKNMALLCLTNTGEILLKFGDYQTADEALSEALRIDPGNLSALTLHQQALSHSGGGPAYTPPY